MSIILNLESITEELRSTIVKKCSIRPAKTQYNSDPDLIDCFSVTPWGVYVPLGAWREFIDEFPDYHEGTHLPLNKGVKCTKEMYTIETDPKGYRDQDVVVMEAYEKLIVDHTVFISASPGFGKTSCANYLGCKLGLKILVMCHLDKVNKQWVKEFEEHSTAKVQLIKGKAKFDPDADVYVIGVLKAANMDPQDFANAGIGTVIFDEAHVATITAFSSSLLKICPKYVIGLSATPERGDGMQKLLSMYFGPKKGYISRQEVKDFVVYKMETNYRPEIRYKVVYGSSILDWTTVLNSIAYNKNRQRDIAEIALSHPEHRIMILSDRIEECVGIYNYLVDALVKKLGYLPIDVSADLGIYLMDESNKKDKIEKIQQYQTLIAGRKRAGIGFDDPTRTMLVLGTDCKDVRQNEGRIRTTNNIVYDVVDNYSTLESHWEQRAAWYEKRGASIVTIPRTDPTDMGRKGKKKAQEEISNKRRLPKNTS
jgi:hypothetical protein